MKVGKLIYDVVSALILLVVLTLAILLVGVKLVGFTPYAVLSGSMEPEYPVGSVVYVKEVPTEDIKIGDAITFYMSDSSTVVTHQVIEIDDTAGLYYTQGLANESPDGQPTSADRIIGKVQFNIPYLGYISTYVTSPPWIYIIVALVLMWVIIMYMVDLSKEEDEPPVQKKGGKKRRKSSQGTRTRQTTRTGDTRRTRN